MKYLIVSMKYLITSLLLGGILLLPQHARRVTPVANLQQTEFRNQPRLALLIGIGAYPDGSGLTPLRYAARDVDLLAVTLEKQGYAVRKLVDSQATRGVVRRSLRELADALDPDEGTFLVYFSGHGFAQDGTDYLATFGTTLDDLKQDGLPLSEVRQLVTKSKTRRKVLFVDACRDNPSAGTRSAVQRSFTTLSASEGLRALYSTRAGRVSYENDDLRQGVFTHFLIRGLQGEAAGADGFVTFRDLADYMTSGMRTFGVSRGQVQLPVEVSQEAMGDFLLARGRPTEPPDLTIAVLKEEAPKSDAKTIPTGNALLEKAITAVGGDDKLAAIKTVDQAVVIDINTGQGQMKVNQRVRWLTPGMIRQDQELPFGKLAVYTDGKSGWMSTPQGVQDLPPPVLRQARSETFRFLPLLLRSGRDPNRRVTLVAENTVEISDKDGNSVKMEFDAATGLPAKLVYQSMQMGGGDVQSELILSGWKDVEGVKLPHSYVVNQGGRKFADAIVQRWTINSELKAEELAQKP